MSTRFILFNTSGVCWATSSLETETNGASWTFGVDFGVARVKQPNIIRASVDRS